ncbi:mitochondrial import inner membrane translocase subunit tim8 [Sarocladium strictum]
MSSIEAQELERLSEADKNDLRKFLTNEQQKTQIQSQTHSMTDMCWKKCVSGSIKSSKLDKNEEGCLTNCVDRFMDLNMLTIKHIQNMRN